MWQSHSPKFHPCMTRDVTMLGAVLQQTLLACMKIGFGALAKKADVPSDSRPDRRCDVTLIQKSCWHTWTPLHDQRLSQLQKVRVSWSKPLSAIGKKHDKTLPGDAIACHSWIVVNEYDIRSAVNWGLQQIPRVALCSHVIQGWFCSSCR